MTFLYILLYVVTITRAQWDPNYAEGHDGIVHLFEWHWDTIADECENYLGPHKFGGVQVSPPNENRPVTLPNGDRPWWERYQPVSYNLDTRSGNRAAFINMVERCNAVGVRIYVDAIINHMLGEDAHSGTGTGGCAYDSDSLDFPCVPFSSNDFNDYRCGSQNGLINNYGDPEEVRNCRLVGLVDLDHSKQSVRDKIAGFMNDLISIGVAGFRVDACKHMWPGETEKLYGLLDNLPTSAGFPAGARPFIAQEVIDQGGEPIKSSDYDHMGTVTEFNYCFSLANLVGSLAQLRTLADRPESWGFLDDGKSFVFINNHDNQRGHGGGGGILTFSRPRDLTVATAMMMALPYGEKRIMSSYFFEDGDQGPPSSQPGGNAESGSCTNGWVCEHRWDGWKNIGMLGGAMRKQTGSKKYESWWDNGSSQVAIVRGEAFFVVNNDQWDLAGGVQTGLPAGTYCDLAHSDMESCSVTFDVDATGVACLSIAGGADVPFIFSTVDGKVGEFSGTNDCKDLTEGPSTDCTSCDCNIKLDCGHMGIDAAGCAEKGCAWCPTTKRGDPWCIWLDEGIDVPTPPPGGGDGCGTATCADVTSREDCGFMGIDQSGCQAKGCLWCPVKYDNGAENFDTPWCVEAPTVTCGPTTAPSPTTEAPPTTQRPTTQGPTSEPCNGCDCGGASECGYSGITQVGCEGRGCIWCPNEDEAPFCRNDETQATTAQTTDGQTTTFAGTGDTTIKPTGPSGGAGCDIPDLADREDCGELASTEATCLASGCCWEEQPPGPIDPEDPDGPWPPWCYYPTK